MEVMKAIIIKYAPNPGRPGGEVPGWLVPDTEGLLAIDMRYEADIEAIPPRPAGWVITHLPTGARVGKPPYTDASSQHEAARIAKRFYEVYKARGWNIYSDKREIIVAPFNGLPREELTEIWEKIADWPKKPATTSEETTGDHHGS